MRREDKEYLDEVAKGIRAEIKASADMINIQLQGIIVRQDKANGTMERVDKETRFAQFVQKRPVISCMVFFVCVTIAVVFVDTFSLGDIMRKIIFKV